MKSIIFISVSLLLLQLSTSHAKIIDVVKLVQSINDDVNLPWKADTYGYEKIDENVLKARTGAKLDIAQAPAHVDPMEMIKLAAAPSTPPATELDAVGLPINFTWADGKSTKCPIRNIRDQSNCGSCWAVSTVSALGDRFCIKTGGNDSVPLSENFVTGCDTQNYGCNGGLMDRVNQFMTTMGTVTGGDYDSDKGCQVYTVRPCGYPLTERYPCSYPSAITPKCRKRKCNNDWYEAVEPPAKVHKAKSWYFVRSNSTHSREDRIREEIAKNGPVTAAFFVPRDFYFYKKGVYVPKECGWLWGGHAVRVVGWGIEDGIRYWHAANSWTSKWGEQGFFKMIRGSNCLSFETMISALVPKLN